MTLFRDVKSGERERKRGKTTGYVEDTYACLHKHTLRRKEEKEDLIITHTHNYWEYTC